MYCHRLMPTLITCLSTGKGTWAEVNRIIQSQVWEKVFLITNQFGNDNFTIHGPIELVVVDTQLDSTPMCEQIVQQIKGKITDFEVALNLVSGSGKEHMAIMEAVIELGLNFRLVTLNKGQFEVMGLKK